MKRRWTPIVFFIARYARRRYCVSLTCMPYSLRFVTLISAWCKAGAGFPKLSPFASGKPAFPALHLRFDCASLATLAKYLRICMAFPVNMTPVKYHGGRNYTIHIQEQLTTLAIQTLSGRVTYVPVWPRGLSCALAPRPRVGLWHICRRVP